MDVNDGGDSSDFNATMTNRTRLPSLSSYPNPQDPSLYPILSYPNSFPKGHFSTQNAIPSSLIETTNVDISSIPRGKEKLRNRSSKINQLKKYQLPQEEPSQPKLDNYYTSDELYHTYYNSNAVWDYTGNHTHTIIPTRSRQPSIPIPNFLQKQDKIGSYSHK